MGNKNTKGGRCQGSDVYQMNEAKGFRHLECREVFIAFKV